MHFYVHVLHVHARHVFVYACIFTRTKVINYTLPLREVKLYCGTPTLFNIMINNMLQCSRMARPYDSSPAPRVGHHGGMAVSRP